MKGFILLLFDVVIGMIGYTINGSIFWAIVDAIFSPLALIKWLVCHQLTLAVLRETFSFLGQ